MLVDIFEPESIEHLIRQSIDITREPLNSQGIADYFWFAVDGHRIQVERKQIDEILSGMDKVEEQLSRELSNGVEETILLIERICQPIYGLKMAVQSWHMAGSKNIMVPGHQYNVSYTGLQAWKSQLDKAGITVVETFDQEATAMTLVALFQNSQKQEHTTLRRYIKEHIYVEGKNPHVLSLMGIKGAGIGEEKAKALIDKYGTLWYTINRDADELAETVIGENKNGGVIRVGIASAHKLLKAIGRE